MRRGWASSCASRRTGAVRHHREMLRTMTDLAHPHLRVNFDTANILYYNENIQGEVALPRPATWSSTCT